jgi:hypothetical protein
MSDKRLWRAASGEEASGEVDFTLRSVGVAATGCSTTSFSAGAEARAGLDCDAGFDGASGFADTVVLACAAGAAGSASSFGCATSVKSTSADIPRPNLLSEIGCLFIERGRVAVSMLQRQYGMDFDAACKVLDDLQEMGLIGPYLGGQRRDILLTRDQWLERVSQAGAAR